jgi:hypothetical protein
MSEAVAEAMVKRLLSSWGGQEMKSEDDHKHTPLDRTSSQFNSVQTQFF